MKDVKLTRYEVRIAPDAKLGDSELVAGSDCFATARQIAVDKARRRGGQTMIYDRDHHAVVEVATQSPARKMLTQGGADVQ